MQLDLFSTKHSIRKDKDTKVCNKCNLELPVDCFSFHGGSNYLRPECKKCNNELSKVRSKIRNSVEPPSKDYCCLYVIKMKNLVQEQVILKMALGW